LNNKKIDKDKHMQIEHFINQIDLTLDPPAEEPLRQYYFIAKARTLVAQMEKEAGRKMTFCVNTFGCQMNLK
jgi:tRNA-2-methylthio-N6-dimethylallyladenosine synthase